jgi:hypothetical protein
MFMSANTYEPLSLMTGAVASVEENNDLPDVHEVQHSGMNHLLT